MSGRGTATAERAARGESRRRAILEATVRLLGSAGPAGITHRRVAKDADVPLAATTYYFDSKDELLHEALKLVATRELERLEAQAAELGRAFSSPGALGRALAGVLTAQIEHERESVVAKFEVYLESARRPGLQSASRHWIEGFRRLAAQALDAAGAKKPAETAELLVAGADGLLLQHLATTGKRADVRPLGRQLEALANTLVTEAGGRRR